MIHSCLVCVSAVCMCVCVCLWVKRGTSARKLDGLRTDLDGDASKNENHSEVTDSGHSHCQGH